MMCTAAAYHPLVPHTPSSQGKKANRLYHDSYHHHEVTASRSSYMSHHKQWRRSVDGYTPPFLFSSDKYPSFTTAPTRFLSLDSTVITGGPFDIVCSLPIELSLAIFSLFSPQDLCNACLVCREWFNLAQDRKLKEKRLQFIHTQRLTFQLCKENYNNGVYSTPQNQQRHHHHHHHHSYRPILSPANNHIVYSDPQHLSRPSPPWSQQEEHIRTPSSYLSNMVERLSLKPDSSDIRRCLFPDDVISSQRQVTGCGSSNITSSHVSTSRKLNRRYSPDLVVGKRSNKGRLRRL